MKNCIKLFLCSICFIFISDFIFAISLTEDNFDRIFNESYNNWNENRDYWKTSPDNNDQVQLTLNVYLNEQEIEFLPKLFPNIKILDLYIDKKNVFDHSYFFSFFEWDDEEIDCIHNNNQSEFTPNQIEKLIKIYPFITTFRLYQKDNIQLWLSHLPLLKDLTHLTIETDTMSDQQLNELCTLKLKFLKLTHNSQNINLNILDQMQCKKEIIKK